jgi:hypothetical protein
VPDFSPERDLILDFNFQTRPCALMFYSFPASLNTLEPENGGSLRVLARIPFKIGSAEPVQGGQTPGAPLSPEPSSQPSNTTRVRLTGQIAATKKAEKEQSPTLSTSERDMPLHKAGKCQKCQSLEQSFLIESLKMRIPTNTPGLSRF